ncbi:hypothetical protein BDZ91DRAFT_714159 [Kalaharituber pfeilii]|nr:hypothetical protein BDZ91DRAFT_714159 [Kalaharituber pfeilii]
MPPFRDDHILIISPGSQTTLAQLGLPESFTPAKFRIPSRMFPGLEDDTWVPIKVRELREGEDVGTLLGVKVDSKKAESSKAKKDVVVGNGAPKSLGLQEGKSMEQAKLEKPKDTSGFPKTQDEKATAATATTMEETANPPTATMDTGAPAPDTAKSFAASTDDQDTELPDADDNEGDDEEGEEGEDLEEGEEHEQEGEGEETQDVEEIVLSDDEEMAEGEEIVEDIIEMPETENGVIYVEDEDDDEGAVWPIQQGKVVNWGAFFALLTYVHELINPTFHTPILIICPPIWNRMDKELVTQFVFEKLKAPGLCLLDSALAVCWAYGLATATVIDVGYEKTDITPVLDYLVCEVERDIISVGGEDMTQHLSKILGGEEKGWGRDLVEQLKCSNICEILDGAKIPIPGTQEPEKIDEILKKGIKLNRDGDEEEEEGVTNVAAIVASGKTHEYLAKKEREKQEALKGAQKNLPNWRREYNKFWAIEKRKPGDADVVMIDQPEQPPAPVPQTQVQEEKSDEMMTDQPAPPPVPAQEVTSAQPAPVPTSPPKTTDSEVKPPSRPGTAGGPSTPRPGASSGEAPPSRPGTSSGDQPAAASGEDGSTNPPAEQTSVSAPPVESDEVRINREKAEAREKRKEEKRIKALEAELRPNEYRREIEVGTERFRAAECGIMMTIADAVYRIISRVDDISRRPELWENLVIVGNGSKIKGFKDTLIMTLTEKYKISPSSATIFTSELPSASSTPLPTGASTPLPPGNAQSSVNPLLLAATTNSLHNQQQQHSSHSLSPMNIRTAKMPDYFPEWKDAGFEEAVVFVVDQGVSRGFLSRVEYNEMGPTGIHSV